jgi:hypothetical protein
MIRRRNEMHGVALSDDNAGLHDGFSDDDIDTRESDANSRDHGH